MRRVYLDHVATTPLHPEVLEAMLPFFKQEFGNPSSIYDFGVAAKNAVEEAREKVAKLINADPSEIIFTSSGAEANNLAVRGIALANQRKGRHVIVSSIEHHSVLNAARYLQKWHDYVVTFLPVDKYGTVNQDEVEKAITKETVLISIMHANNEVGTIGPIKEISQSAREKEIYFHTDAVATVGNIPVNVEGLEVDALTLSGHGFYGPKGAGALYVKKGVRITPLIYGGIQEDGKRAGTENVPAIVGMGKAAEIAKGEREKRISHIKPLRDKLISEVLEIDNIYLTGHPTKRLHGHASFCVEFIEGESMLLMLSMEGIYAASGSACISKALKASPVLLAMGIPPALAQGSIVFTLGMDNTEEEINYLLDAFPPIVGRLRKISPFKKDFGAFEAKSAKG